MRARRSCLSVPGSSEAMLAKAASLAADEVVVDLEDSVARRPRRRKRARWSPALLEAASLAGAHVARAGERAREPVVRRRRERARRSRRRRGSARSSCPRSRSRRTWSARPRCSTPSASRPRGDARPGARGDRARTARGGRDRVGVPTPGHADPGLRRSRRLAGAAARSPTSPELWLHAQDTVARGRAGIRPAGDRRPVPRHPRRAGPARSHRAGAGARLRRQVGGAPGPARRRSTQAFTPPAEEFERASAIVAALERAAGDEGRGAVELTAR